MGFEGFNLRAIDIDGHDLLDDINADDQTVLLFFRYEYALSTSEQAALDAYPHAFHEVRISTTGEAMLHQGAHRSDLLIGYGHRSAIDAHNTCHTKRFQHGDFLLHSKIAKEITTEQWHNNMLN